MSETPSRFGRRRRHRRIGVWALLAAVATWAFAIEPAWLAERRYAVDSPAWQLPAITIGIAADLHVGAPHAGLAMLDRVVAGLNAAQPDLVLLPGDFVIHGVVAGTPVDAETIAAHLAKLAAPLGVFATLGNHDWWYDGGRMRRALESHGIRVLDNEVATLEVASGRFALVGIGDDMTGHDDVLGTMRKVPRGLASLVMVHDPANAPELPAGPALAFAGHTHGGQVRLPFVGALVTPGRSPLRHAYGWIDAGPVPTYVTSGVGTSILPLRFNCRPEYVLVRLAPAPAGNPRTTTTSL